MYIHIHMHIQIHLRTYTYTCIHTEHRESTVILLLIAPASICLSLKRGLRMCTAKLKLRINGLGLELGG